MAESEATNFFSHALYDKLKFVAQIVLPALGTLVFTVGGIWGWDATTKVVGTITAVDLFLGLVLQISSTQYYKAGANFDGEAVVTKDPTTGENQVTFAFNQNPTEVVDDPGKHSLEYKIEHPNQGS
jgi:putative holin Dp-1